MKIQKLTADQAAPVVTPAYARVRVVITVRPIVAVVITRRGRGCDPEAQNSEPHSRTDPAAMMMVTPADVGGRRRRSLTDRLIVRGDRQRERRRCRAEQ